MSDKLPKTKAAAAKAAPAKKIAVTKSAAKIAKPASKATKKVALSTTPEAPAIAMKQAVISKAASVSKVAKKAVAKKAPAKKSPAKKAASKAAANKAVATKKIASNKAASGKKPASSGLPARTVSAGEKLRNAVLKALEDMKAKDVVVIDVRQRTSITDDLVFASGTSTRHVKSIADEVVKAAKAIKMPPIGVEGEKEAEWVLVDLADIVVHVMLPKTREFYALERMWGSAGDHTEPQ